MLNSPEKKKDIDNKKGATFKTNLYQKDTNYSITLSIVEGKLQILVKASKNFSDDIYEYSNTYSFKQLQITNKYFSRFKNIEEVCSDLDSLLKLKVTVEEEKDKSIRIKIPILNEKSLGDIIFKLIRTKKIKKVRHSPDKLKGKNKPNNKKAYESNIKGINDNNNTNNELLLGNINELVKRVKNLEKKEVEKEKKIKELKEDINNYQEKINTSMNYPVYPPLANKNINLAEDNNNNISQIIKQRNEKGDDDDIDMSLDTDKNGTIKKKKKKEIKNKSKSKSKNKKKESSDEESVNSSETPKKKRKERKFSSSSDDASEKNKDNISNGKEDSEQDKSVNKFINNKKKENKNIDDIVNIEKPKPLYNSIVVSGFPLIQRENLKDYINSRIFYTRKEMQMVKNKITKGKKNLHAYFDLLYRATYDGDYEETINTLCEGHYPQITLFLTQEGARFGIYIDKEKTTSFFRKIVSYKEKPGTSFLFSLNWLKTYEIKQGETATDNRTEKLCFGRTYKYNNNESNWIIYVPRNEFLGVDLKFGDKESEFGDIKYSEIIGYIDTYHLKDVEIFQVMIDKDGNDDDNDDYKNIIEEKENNKEKNKEKNKNKNKIYNDETIDGQKSDDEDKENNKEKEDEKNKVEENNKKKDDRLYNDDEDSD